MRECNFIVNKWCLQGNKSADNWIFSSRNDVYMYLQLYRLVNYNTADVGEEEAKKTQNLGLSDVQRCAR